MAYSVVFTPEAEEQLAVLYRYVAAAASPEIAERFTGAIVTHCEQPVSAAPIPPTDHEPPALLLPHPYVILSNAKDLLLRPLKTRSFALLRMTC